MPLWLAIILLGIIEGITEFLPVSSTAHLLIPQALNWLPKQTDLFNVVIQSGAVLAVLPLFPDRLRQFIFRWREPATQDYLLKIFVAFFITGVGGFILEHKNFKLQEQLLPIAVALAVGGVMFVGIEHWLRDRSPGNRVTWPIAFAIGFAQLVAAIFPGTSRSGACILIALLLSQNRVAATEFAFLVGIPTMLAASAYKIFKALHNPPAGTVPENWAMLGLGFIVAAIVSFIVVKWLLHYIQTHTFTAFGYYRIILALGIAGLLIAYPNLRQKKPEANKPTAAALAQPAR